MVPFARLPVQVPVADEVRAGELRAGQHHEAHSLVELVEVQRAFAADIEEHVELVVFRAPVDGTHPHLDGARLGAQNALSGVV